MSFSASSGSRDAGAAGTHGSGSPAPGWDVAIDVGGTFVDIAVRGAHGLRAAKYPRAPGSPAQSVLGALDALAAEGLAPASVRRILHGTTIATNLLLERRAAPVGMIVTRGFGDVPTLGRQSRRDLYRPAIAVQTPVDIAPEVLRCEVAGRLDARGEIGERLDRGEIEAAARRLEDAGVRSVAVCLLFSHLDGSQERQVREWLRAASPGLAVSLSCEVDPRPREYERWQSTVLDAYVKPGVGGYLAELGEGLAARGYPPVLLMRSLGGVAPADTCLAVPASLAMSGPAAAALGVAGMLDAQSAAGVAVSVDIGGTTADLSLLRQAGVDTTTELSVGELSLRMHSLAVRSVPVGGGSLVRIDAAGGIVVGPESAGADPGPAAYGRGGERPTLTDCLVVLGIAPARLAGGIDMDAAAAARAVSRELAGPLGVCVREAAQAALQVANAMLAESIKQVAIDGGLDPRAVTLVAAGGGGGLHVAQAAALAGIRRVVVPALPGVAAAVGLLQSPLVRVAEHALDVALDDAGLAAAHAAARTLAFAPLMAEDYPLERPVWFLDVGYEGQAFTLALPVDWAVDSVASLRERFDAIHCRVRGQVFAARQRVRGLRLVHAQHPGPAGPGLVAPPSTPGLPRTGAGTQEWDRQALAAGQCGSGPARILAADTTIWVPAGWEWCVADGGALILSAPQPASREGAGKLGAARRSLETAPAAAERIGVDTPAGLDVLRLRLEGIADRMQQALVRSAVSSVAREGMDCAAALFLPDGRIIAQARSLPLLLGSMIPAMAGVLRAFPAAGMAEGEAYLLNDPWSGGTHLPDIVMVRPILHGGAVAAFAASILHHQDVGGSAPGSVPPDAADIHQEGLRIPPVRWRTAGGIVPDVAAILAANSRTPDNLLGDLDAQWAAISLGAREMSALLHELPEDTFPAAAQALIERAERMTRAALAVLPDGEFSHADALDTLDTGEPARLCVTIRKQGEAMALDFAGTSPQVRAPVNAPPAAMLSAAFFFMRTLAPDAPNNHGCLSAMSLHLPPGSLVDPRLPAAVNARTATVKLACNALLAAWAKADPARAVAPNAGVAVVLSVGGKDAAGRPFFFTEIIAGGAGAHPGGAGVSGVSTDVGNARNLPAEMLEAQAPIRVMAHARRRGSGGAGRHPGGDGVVRRYLLLEGEAMVSYRGERHEGCAAGAAGGGAGLSSRAWLQAPDGSRRCIASKARFAWVAGECLVIETAGGGGWGHTQDTFVETSVLTGSCS
ncbi:hypothetical protein FOZ76_17865 [Verticiella sediminum]|uniref:Hydantoinase/oxoprolinase family protein n=1 Tax=Verticiella sediminum TaxID=1247510 RepID=A0A556AFV1_9BURK|nr:hydantoinase B/oxoprolinase family protein [Verticiella sediminum]TSH91764.1 hypothetical protein FOZ76_17865 [Verticiella sediminum]